MSDSPPPAGDPIVVIGVGNRFRGDDAVGLAVVDRLREATLPGVTVRESDGDPVDLLHWWEAADTAVVVDAVVSGRPPGTLVPIDCGARELPATYFRQSTHLLSIAEAVELGRALGRLPRRLVLVGVEAESFAPGAAMTPAVAASVAGALREVISQVEAAAAIASGSG